MRVGAGTRLKCRNCQATVVFPAALAVIVVTLDRSCKLYEAETKIPLHRCEIRYGLECRPCGIRDPSKRRAWHWWRNRSAAFRRPACARCHQMLTTYVVAS